jgi:superfamily II DNA or RNA helicase
MMNLRNYQQQAVAWIVPRKRGMVVAPAGSGKTIIASHAAAQALRPGEHGLWVANTREQVDQAIAALTSTPGPEDVTWRVECVAAGPSAEGCSLVVVDEAHHAPAETWAALINSLPTTCRLWGFTATPWHEDEERNDAVIAAFEEFFEIEREDVMAGGHLVPGIVRVIDVDKTGERDLELRHQIEEEFQKKKMRYLYGGLTPDEARRRIAWQFVQEDMASSSRRNGAIVSLARAELEQGATTIVLVGSVAHGEFLASQIPGAELLHAKLPKKERRRRVKALRSGELKCAVATSLMDEGADFPVASVLILAAPGKSATKTIQRAGRVMRPHPGKEHGIVYDFADRGWRMAHGQHRKRLAVYRGLGYAIGAV